MKCISASIISLVAILLLGIQCLAAEQSIKLKPQLHPSAGLQKTSPTQVRIQFKEQMDKTGNFQVKCSPQVKGKGFWGNNNKTWTFDLKTKVGNQSLPGGATCQVSQVGVLKNVSGSKMLVADSVNYSFHVNGPVATSIQPAPGIAHKLGEKNPVIVVTFNGAINKDKFFKSNQNYLQYTSDFYVKDLMYLRPVPKKQQNKIYAKMKKGYFPGFYRMNKDGSNWLMMTTQKGQKLSPAAEVMVHIGGAYSAYDLEGKVKAKDPVEQKLLVRKPFKAEFICDRNPMNKAKCLPTGLFSVELKSFVKWKDLKKSRLKYVELNSPNQQMTIAQPDSDQVHQVWASQVADKFGLELDDDVLVNKIQFKVEIEPKSTATISIPKGLKDKDGRKFYNRVHNFQFTIDSYQDSVQMITGLKFQEKSSNQPSFYKFKVMSLKKGQTLSFHRNGSKKQWTPITNKQKIVQLLKAYTNMGPYRKKSQKKFKSPMHRLGVKSNSTKIKIDGDENRYQSFEKAYPTENGSSKSGLYVTEILSSIRAKRPMKDFIVNPSYSLIMLTDLSVTIKKGTEKSLVWVTRLSTGMPVSGANISIHDCNGTELIKAQKTGPHGIYQFKNLKESKACKIDYRNSGFYVFASKDGDTSFTKTSWTRQETARRAPGLDYDWPKITDGRNYFHAVIGANLVKPGQIVPGQIIVKKPGEDSIEHTEIQSMFKSVKLISYTNSDVYFDLPLVWKNGVGEFEWKVPSEENVTLGEYQIELQHSQSKDDNIQMYNSTIEVAQFKVSLMNGSLSVKSKDDVKPDSLMANAMLRYANGIGAKDHSASLSYYFAPTGVHFSSLDQYSFSNGEFELNRSDSTVSTHLPTQEKPETLEDLSTDKDGNISVDVSNLMLLGRTTVGQQIQKIQRPYSLIAKVRYQDQSGEYQTLSASQKIYHASKFIGVDVVEGLKTQASLNVVVADTKGKKLSPAKAKMAVLKIETKIIQEELFGGIISKVIEQEIVETDWKSFCHLEDMVNSCRMDSLKPGSYVFQVTEGNQTAHVKFKINNKNRVFAEYDSYYEDGSKKHFFELTKKDSKKSYNHGDLATLSFAPPFEKCAALVTMERANVLAAKVDYKACENKEVNVQINAKHAPNAFASVYLVSGRKGDIPSSPGELDVGKPTYRVGYQNLKIGWDNYALDVKVQLKKESKTFQPDEQIDVEVEVKAKSGETVNSHVTLFAIEERILKMKPNATMNLLDALMGARGHSVHLANVYSKLETPSVQMGGMPESAKMESGGRNAVGFLTASADEGHKVGEEGGSGGELESFKREKLDSLVTWQTQIPVVDGVAKTHFKANHKVGANFVVFALVMDDPNQKFGTGSEKYLSEKDVQSFSNISAVTRDGDSMPVRVNLQNNLGKDQDFKVVVGVTYKDKDGNVIGSKTISKSKNVKSKSSSSIEVAKLVTPKFMKSGDSKEVEVASISYQVKVQDQQGLEVDNLGPIEQKVLPAVPLSVQDEFLAQTEDGLLSWPFEKPLGALEDQGQLKIVTAKSLVDSVRSQIVSELKEQKDTPLFIESKILKAMLLATKSNNSNLKSAMTGMMKLADRRGMIKYYSEASQGSMWLTLNIISALQTKSWVYDLVPQALQKKWQNSMELILSKKIEPAYISNEASDYSWFLAQTKAASAALSMKNEALQQKATETLEAFNQSLNKNGQIAGVGLGDLDNLVLADFVYALSKMNPSTAAQSSALKELSEQRLNQKVTSATIKVDPDVPYFRWWGYSDEILETSKLITALSNIVKTSSEKSLDKLIIGIVNAQKQKKWYNLRTKTWVLTAMQAFSKVEGDKVEGETFFKVSEQEVPTAVEWSDDIKQAKMEFDWKKQTASVDVSHQDGEGQPWVSVIAKSAVKLSENRENGMSVNKTLVNTNSNRKAGQYKAGDVIEVTLNLDAKTDLNHVVMFDPIPSGANILRDGTGQYSSATKSYAGFKVYFHYLYQGMRTVKYRYQLNNPGEYNLPPTRAQGVYEPGLFGETPNAKMSVAE